MVDRIINEINNCYENGCYIASLTLALILPDICGKAKYPEEENNKIRYIKWFDEYIGQYEKHQGDSRVQLPYLSGEIIYSLRCSMLHQGNPSIDKSKLNIEYFELRYSDKSSCNDVQVAQAEIVKDKNGNDIAIHKKICLSIRDICYKITQLAKFYYDNNKEKFNFFDYELVNMDYRAKNIFIKKDRGDY